MESNDIHKPLREGMTTIPRHEDSNLHCRQFEEIRSRYSHAAHERLMLMLATFTHAYPCHAFYTYSNYELEFVRF